MFDQSEYIEIWGDSSKYNWFINSVLHVYLRLPKIGTFLIEKLTPEADLNLNTDLDKLLVDIITKATVHHLELFEKIPIIDINEFRKSLKSEESDLFQSNKNGDAALFMDYFDNFLERIVEAVNKEARMCETAFHINFATTDVRPNTAMNVDKKKSEIFTFPAHKIIPFIENRKSEIFFICLLPRLKLLCF